MKIPFSFYYLIPAHNEEASIPQLLSKLEGVMSRFPGSRAYIIENGSSDRTWSILQEEVLRRPWLHISSIKQKGLGRAFQAGALQIAKDLSGTEAADKNIKESRWIVFTAADLPFGFSDLESFLKQLDDQDVPLFVGSKSHSESQVDRGFLRNRGSWALRILRSCLLKMKTQDPNGTLFLRSDFLSLTDRVQASDYFYTTELIYYVEQKTRVCEMPVQLEPEIRPSKVRMMRDGFKMLKQIWLLKKRGCGK